MRLTRVTITGADETVHPTDLFRLWAEFPFAEFGVLLSRSRQGKERRYPAPRRVWMKLGRTPSGFPWAGHLCGSYMRDAVGGPFLWAVENNNFFRRFGRVQFNGAAADEATVDRLATYRRHFPDKEFILQVQKFDRPYVGGGLDPARLLDRSGGRGIELADFPPADPIAHCGYAGGFGPDNLAAVLAKLTALPGDREFWVDMESKVRTVVGGQDTFDLAKVRACLEIAHPFVHAGGTP